MAFEPGAKEYDGNGSPPLPRISKWAFWGAGAFFGLIFLLGILSVAKNAYTDWLWFDHLGYLKTFTNILVARILLFVFGALFIAGLVALNFYLAFRFSRGPQYLAMPQYQLLFARRLTVAGAILVAFIITVAFGYALSGRWHTVLLVINSVRFGQADPIFGKDVSFYIFSLPFLHLLQGWLLGALIVVIIFSLGAYLVRYSVRGVAFTLTKQVHAHIAVLGALLMLAIAFGHVLDIYELLYSGRGAAFGAAYADVHARLPALRLLAAFAAAAALLMVASPFVANPSQRTRLALGAFGLWAIAGIAAGVIFPGLMQRFVVDPNELGRETPYINYNIQWTRAGFGLDRVNERPFPLVDAVTSEDLTNNPETINNIRLWDHRPLRDLYNQIQHLRQYYQFLDVDIDRYTVDGQYRQVMLAAREIIPEQLDPEAQRWINQKLQYTHGYGVAMSPVTEFTDVGRPNFFLKDIPPAGDISVTRPEVYYGEGQRGFVVVNTKELEFDRPATEEATLPARVEGGYQGTGGVRLSSFLRRIAYAWQFGDINILISGQITPESRIKYRRTIKERVETLAPFLMLDPDPYVVVDDGRLFWIQDAYTITDRYPYSKRSKGGFNYIRNSVKVVVDAYNGTAEFYVFEPGDPLIQAYAKAFPTLFKPREAMPEGLRNHVRYPEGLFSTQAQIYLQYHMTDASVFFNKEDVWEVPQEVFFENRVPVEPYYVIMKLPGESKGEFILLLPFSPANKPNLVGWLAARSDPPNYGGLVSFAFPKDRQVFGTAQVEARIDNDPIISQQFTLWGQVGSRVLRGNLLVIPLGHTLIYVEPVFLQAANLNFPELKRVIIATADRVVMMPTLQESLAGILAKDSRVATGPLPLPTGPTGPSTISQQELQAKIQALRRTIKALSESLAKLEESVKELEQLVGGAQ